MLGLAGWILSNSGKSSALPNDSMQDIGHPKRCSIYLAAAQSFSTVARNVSAVIPSARFRLRSVPDWR